jgi:spore germination protein KB
MLQTQVVNHRQIAWLVGSVLLTGSMVTFYQSVAQVAKMDAWFSQILPVMYAIFMSYVFKELVHVFPGKNLFEIVFLVCGKWLGGCINLILIAFLWLILIVDVKGLAHFIQASLLPQTPVEIVLLVFVLLLMSYRTLEVAARVNEIYFPTNLLMTITVVFLLTNEYSGNRFEPLLSSGLTEIFVSNYMAVGLYGDLFVFGAFLPIFVQPQLFYAAMKHGIIIVGLISSLLLLAVLAVMGYTITSRLNYPMLALVQQIHVTDFLDRVEIFMLSLWFPAFTIKAILSYLALLTAIGTFGGGRQHKPYNPAVGSLLVVLSLLTFRHVEELETFLGYTYTTIVLLVQVPLLLFLFIWTRIKKSERPGEKEGIPVENHYSRMYRVMSWTSNLSILGCVISVLVGKWFYEMDMAVGKWVALIYIGLLLVAVVASYYQMQAVNHYLHKTSKTIGSTGNEH